MLTGRATLAAVALLAGCKAELLGVELPRGGPEAISVEDLQRDTFALTTPDGSRLVGEPGHRAAVGHFGQRLQQMKMLPGFGQDWQRDLPDGGVVVCGRKDGAGEGAVLALALDPGTGVRSGPLSLAAAVSLAKAFDTPHPPPRALLVCGQFAGVGPARLDAGAPVPKGTVTGPVLLLTGFGGDPQADGDAPLGLPGGWTGRPWPGGAVDPALPDAQDQIDYRVVAGQVRRLHAAVMRQMTD